MRREPGTPTPFSRFNIALSDMLIGMITRLAGGCDVYGRENVPASGCLIAPNHISFLDPQLTSYALPRYTYFMAKRELFEIPFIRWWIRVALAFPVEMDSPDRTAIRYAVELLKRGECLTVFPEAGRSPDGTLQPAQLGVAFIARAAGVPIVPCAIIGIDKVLPLEAKFFHRGHTRVMFGEPIDPMPVFAEHPGKEGLQVATDMVMDSIRRMQLQLYEMAGETPPQPRPRDASAPPDPA
ncbi:MAG TPA: 1-acyl-sn-glycerol-3-phosphate acyltransferase [Armatimonadetes bacterium]|jgi:1-acyl-sn-glycerol-3-phosphate acyltransferase|nr:1-acyl-sn-glycerol-3-phosphate acyltransferase [Armatimonadota bacterium]